MAKRKSAQRRNKKFKAADPFARGKSQKNLGQVINKIKYSTPNFYMINYILQDVGFGYTGGMEDMPKNLKTILKKEKQSTSAEKKPKGRTDKEKKKSAVYRMLSEGRFSMNRYFFYENNSIFDHWQIDSDTVYLWRFFF